MEISPEICSCSPLPLKFNSPSSACTTGDWTAFLKSICSLLLVNKIFEVGISGSLQEQMKYLKLDIVQKAGSCISTDLAYVIGVIDVSRSKDKGSVTSVLVHSGGVHDGHYYAYIRPTLMDQSFKFDDVRVTKEDIYHKGCS
ncbi:hypothetical protein ACSBR2_003852 [Camellia fascicularis]